MGLDTDLFRRKDAVSIERITPGIRTRALLLTSLVLIIAGTTASSLYIIRSRLQRQVRSTLQADLEHSVETFQDLEAGRLAALERENALMAALPSLKALMTTDDTRTIADDGVDFWKTSGNELFALADPDRRVQAAYAEGAVNPDILRHDLQAAITAPSKHYLMSGGRLFEYSVEPLYFGSRANGTLLGYVISGYAIDNAFLREVGRGAGAEAAFFAGERQAGRSWRHGAIAAAEFELSDCEDRQRALSDREQGSDRRSGHAVAAGGDEVV
jgi:hypothetical protein